ncbi:MAG: hypothetical protein AAGD01_16005 [Acidobacteriota bacterium]
MSHVHVTRYRPGKNGEVRDAVAQVAAAISEVDGVISSRVFGDHSHVILITEFEKWAVLDSFEGNDAIRSALPPLARAEDGRGEFWFGQ